MIDYMKMLNTRDGGVNGVKLFWEKCETQYQNDRIVECYERMKNRGAGMALFHPMSTGGTYSVFERAAEDRNPGAQRSATGGPTPPTGGCSPTCSRC